MYADPKEAERQRKKDWYAQNKDEISKRRRQARELKRLTTMDMIDHQSQLIPEPCKNLEQTQLDSQYSTF